MGSSGDNSDGKTRGGPPGSAVIVVAASVIYLVNSLVWMYRLRDDTGPDEPDHFIVAEFIAENYRLPVLGRDLHAYVMQYGTFQPLESGIDEETGQRYWIREPGQLIEPRMPYAAFPGLNYVVSAVSIRIGRMVGFSNDRTCSRIPSALFGAAAILLIGLAAAEIFRGRSDLVLLSVSLPCLLPQFTYLGTYCNADSYTVMAGAFLVWTLARAALRGWSIPGAIAVGVGGGLCLVGKFNGYALLPGAAFFALVTMPRRAKSVVAFCCVGALTALVISSPWFFHNYRSYGELWGTRASADAMSELFETFPKSELPINMTFGFHNPPREHGVTLYKLLTSVWVVIFAKSFVGRFGWGDRPLDAWQYGLYAIVALVALAGLALAAFRSFRSRTDDPQYSIRALLVLFGVSAVVTSMAMILYGQLNLDIQPQARYLFPSLPILSCLYTVGTAELLDTLKCGRNAPRCVAALLIVLNVTAYLKL